ncbi:MAG: 4Fe-4S dicluster domain-containing protein [Methylococcales bacterium]|nr:4Fe-4S dicluster domain-containing protein [Methylococcales bacterium]
MASNEKEGAPVNTRREFLVKISAAGALTITPGLFLYKVAEAKSDNELASANKRWGMLIDTARCADGCNACVEGCNKEHGLTGHGREATDAQWMRKVTVTDKSIGKTISLPIMCQHCENPPCADVCPTGASFKRKDNIVLVDKHICIGCRYCMMACPYKARSFIHEELSNQKSYSPRGKGTVESCTFCVHRVDQDKQPACVEACNESGHKAIVFGDMKDPNSELSVALKTSSSRQIRADLGLNPGVRYKNF